MGWRLGDVVVKVNNHHVTDQADAVEKLRIARSQPLPIKVCVMRYTGGQGGFSPSANAEIGEEGRSGAVVQNKKSSRSQSKEPRKPRSRSQEPPKKGSEDQELSARRPRSQSRQSRKKGGKDSELSARRPEKKKNPDSEPDEAEEICDPRAGRDEM